MSLLLYFSDCIRRNGSAKRMGAGLLVCVLLLQLFSFSMRFLHNGSGILFSNYDFFFLICISLVITALILTFLKKSEFTAFLINLIGFILTILNRLSSSSDAYALDHWHAVQGLLSLHIILAGLSYVAFTLSAVFAVMYWFLHRRLKLKKWNDTVRRFPSLEKLEKYVNVSMIWGTFLLAVSLSIAVSIVVAENRWDILEDMKVLFSFVALVIYLLYFAGRRMKRYTGMSMAKWALIGYIVTISNFLLNSWSAFHQWTGGN
nr:cytochrome c biogenesis protein CcsA [Paenibacillus shirakamiensis]